MNELRTLTLKKTNLTMKTQESNGIFPCPEEGCSLAYKRLSNLQSHLEIGRHARHLRDENTLNAIKRKWYNKWALNKDAAAKSYKGREGAS